MYMYPGRVPVLCACTAAKYFPELSDTQPVQTAAGEEEDWFQVRPPDVEVKIYVGTRVWVWG